jgi:L-asparagine transporter-like permease
MLEKLISLPIFLLIAAGLCILIRGAGFVFVSQISNYFAIAIIIVLTIKDCRAEKIPESDSRQPLYKYAPCAALFFFFVTPIALETTMFSFGIMTTVALVCSVVVFFATRRRRKKSFSRRHTFSVLPRLSA